LHAFPDLDRLLAAALDEDGRLRDDASPALRAIRRELRTLRAEIEQRLARLFHQPGSSSVIADEYVTVRNGRYVVPVRTQSAAELPGIVQDRSASGETLFVEPLFAVERNNRLLIAAREEAEEEARILVELTAAIGAQADALEEAFAALVELDTLAARSGFARLYHGVCPVIGGDSIRLGRARHPLLVLAGREVTPIDVELEETTRLLLVTGPNTGGKSVALKTLGLAALMAQSGVPIFADEDARLPLFTQVLTDIGDQQTVAGDLSTFSGHIVNLREILAESAVGSLVLLDEPGASTDPDDGAALAKAILQALVERGARVLATTHFQAVKLFALNQPGAQVAAVDFDPETFSPLYRLIYGSVGPSLGLPIARRLGLPSSIVDAASCERGAGVADLGAAVAQLDEQRRRYEAQADAVAVERHELAGLREAQEALLAELHDKRRRKWADELGEARRFAEELRSEGRRLLAEARERPAVRARALHELGREQGARIEAQERAFSGLSTIEAAGDEVTLAPGDQVEVSGSGVRGTLVQISGERAQISRGTVRFDVPAKQLRRVPGAAPSGSGRGEGARRSMPSAEPAATSGATLALPSAEINLIGERVQSGLIQLEAFLDRAVVDDATTVRVVHGTGTGALRSAVREFLATSPYVAGFADGEPNAGGAGVTIVRLR
jgi:DNA mismatch repair protein MutS2